MGDDKMVKGRLKYYCNKCKRYHYLKGSKIGKAHTTFSNRPKGNHGGTTMNTYYTTEGPIRGSCGHRHRSREAAERCLDEDRKGCRSQGGYSDRSVKRVVRRRK